MEAVEANYRDFSLFHNMDDDQIRRFMAMGFNFRYSAGAPLVSKSDAGDTFFLILSGTAKIVLTNTCNQPLNVSLIRAGEFFGELSILESRSNRTADVVAVSDMEVLTFQKPEFMRALNQMPVLAINIARTLGQRLRATNERLSMQTLSEEGRIAGAILQVAKKGKAYVEGGPILLPYLSLQEWTLFCSTTHERFMGVMERLKERGALEWQNQRIVVKDVDGLNRFASEVGTASSYT